MQYADYDINLSSEFEYKNVGDIQIIKKKKLNINIKEYIMRFHLYAYCQFASFFNSVSILFMNQSLIPLIIIIKQ